MIKNRADLARFHGQSSKIVISALEAAIKSVEPGALVGRAVKGGKTLVIKGISGSALRLDDFQDIYVVGAGKATGAMADALCKIVKVKRGAINVPHGARVTDAIETTNTSHPVPDASGVRGTKKIVDIVNKAGRDDLVFVLISGGGSALMPLPAKGVSLHDKQEMTAALLASGASIHEINAVRKHLSAVKGGQLVRQAKCRIISLVLSDVIGDDLGVIASGPTLPDPSTFADALRIVKKYGIRGAAAGHIEKGAKGLLPETPKQSDPIFSRVHNFIIGNNAMACKAAASHLRHKGLVVDYLGSSFGGEAGELGRRFAHLASTMQAGSAIVAGGESTVRLGKKHGMGGRNQEAALAYAVHAKNSVIAAFMGTDGIDGNSDAAGAIVSSRTAEIAKKIGRRYLAGHDSYHALEKMNSLVFTGLTGTNVNDITILVADKDVA